MQGQQRTTSATTTTKATTTQPQQSQLQRQPQQPQQTPQLTVVVGNDEQGLVEQLDRHDQADPVDVLASDLVRGLGAEAVSHVEVSVSMVLRFAWS